MQWLKSADHSDKVKAIRATDDKEKRDELKAKLPGITPSGTFGYRDQNKLIDHSGLIQFDIDSHDNEHLKNYSKLKEQIINISNVAYCGLSVSGRGYWGLVPIKYPDKHKAHFRALSAAFESFGMRIDQAPKNVASLRGYSFDPDGYFNHNAEVFEFTKEKPKPRPRPTANHEPIEHSDRYAEVALNDELHALAQTTNGNRNNQLFKSSASLAQLVGGGVLGKSEVARCLYDTAIATGLPKREVENTINSGFKAGLKNPRQPTENNRSVTPKKKDKPTEAKSKPDEPPMGLEEFNKRFNSYPSAPF